MKVRLPFLNLQMRNQKVAKWISFLNAGYAINRLAGVNKLKGEGRN